ncbi:DUF4139 domain-containing protein [archaeon]|nr:DUF4139 domain-containing protein [archaeon]
MNNKILAAIFLVVVMIAGIAIFVPQQNNTTEPTKTITQQYPLEIVGEVTSERAPITEHQEFIVSSPDEMIELAGGTEVSPSTGVEITIYNQNFGLVKDKREIPLQSGTNLVKFTDVASRIDATSVHFKSLTGNARVIEQNYEYDLVSTAKLIEKYIDKEVAVHTGEDTFIGTLLSSTGGIVLQTTGGVVSISEYDNIEFPELPQGLITKPTLVWQVFTDLATTHNVEVSYLTDGITWNSDYVAVINNDDTALDLEGWVTIDNKAGTNFADAQLKLVAGDVNRVTPQPEHLMYDIAYGAGGDAAPKGFSEESFYEYHLYTLGRPTTVKENQMKQIELLSAEEVPVTKEYVFEPSGSWYSSSSSGKVKTMLNLKNSEENGVGMPLPKGRVRVYKADSTGQLQFVGEDQIDHTPKDEEIRIFTGNAFDITGEATTTNQESLGRCSSRKTRQIKLRNHKEENIKVTVIEYIGTSWEITDKTHDYEKTSATKINFKVDVPKDEETTIEYTLYYDYC